MKMKWNDPIRRYFWYRGCLSRAYLPILTIFMVDQGLSLGQIAIVLTIGQIASLCFEVPSGAIADTVGHKRSLILSLFGQAISALLWVGGSFPWMIAATIVYYFFGSLMTGTSEALFFEYVKSLGKQTEHLKLWGAAKSFSRIVNAATLFVGGASYALNHHYPFYIGALVFIAGAVIISTFPKVASTKSVEAQEGFRELMQHFPRALKTIWSQANVFWLVMLNGLLLGTIGGSNDFQQIIFTHLLASTLFVSAVYSIKRLLSMFVSGWAHRIMKLGAVKIMTLFCLFTVLSMIITPFVHSAILYGAVVLIAIVVFSFLDVIFNDMLNQAIPSLSRATTLSVANFVEAAVSILAASIFGWLGTTPEKTFFYLGAGLFILCLIPLIQLARRQTPTPLDFSLKIDYTFPICATGRPTKKP